MGFKIGLGINSADDKSIEIPAVQQLIDLLDLKGAVITADALHRQVETAAKIVEREADYVLIAKRNQESLQSAIRETLANAFEEKIPRLRQCTVIDKSRDQVEMQDVVVLPAPKNSALFSRPPNIKTIGGIYRSRKIVDQHEECHDCLIRSLRCIVRKLRDHLRLHWSIENSGHHILDVSFTEESSRIRMGAGPDMSSVFRRLALTILKQDISIKESIRGKHRVSGWDESAFVRHLAGFSEV